MSRESPINILVARMLLGSYVCWKTVWYNWDLFVQTPFTLAGEPYKILLPPAPSLVLTVEKWTLIVIMFTFVVGYHLRTSSFLGALLLGHLGAIRFTLDPSGATTSLFIAVWFLMLFGLFDDQQLLTVDSFRGGTQSLRAANRFLKSDLEAQRMDALRWSLLAIALLYFGAGFSKVTQGPIFEWATVENLSRTIVMMNARNAIPGGLGPYLVQYPWLIFVGAWGTIFLELGLVLAVILGFSITPFVLGIFSMHLVIGLAMGPFFFDIYPLLLIFVAWDNFLKIFSSDDQLTVVYDDRCLFCARSLLLFKSLDVRGSIRFRDQNDIPQPYRNNDISDITSAMYVFKNGDAYRGYYAFRELFNHFKTLRWCAWIMNQSPVSRVGEKIYEWVANNRNRYVTCSVE